jgi:hypothetical protein
MKRLLPLLTLAWALLGAPAFAAPVSLGLQLFAANTGSSQSLTTTAACPAGNYIWTFSVSNTSTAVYSLAPVDSASNTYTLLTLTNIVNNNRSRPSYSKLTTTLPSGGTITFTYNDATARHWIGAVCLDGLTASALDLNVTGTTAQNAAPTLTTGTFTQPTEVVPLFLFVNGAASGGDTVTLDPAWTLLQSVNSTDFIMMAYRTVSATTPITYTGSIAPSALRSWGIAYTSFVLAAAGGTTPRLLTLGVGQ